MNSISDIALRLTDRQVLISKVTFSTVLVCGVAGAAFGFAVIFAPNVVKVSLTLKITAPLIVLGFSFAGVAIFGLKSVSKRFKPTDVSEAFYKEFYKAQISHYMPDESVVNESWRRVGFEGARLGYTHLKYKKIYLLDFLHPFPEKNFLNKKFKILH